STFFLTILRRPPYTLFPYTTLFRSTAAFLIWILAASLSTSKEIFSGAVFDFASGFHFENYINAWNTGNVSVYFGNSLLYATVTRSEEHTSELQSRFDLVCRLLLEKK